MPSSIAAASFWLGRTRRDRWGRALVLSLALPLALWGLGHLRFLTVLELKTEDLRYRLRGSRAVHPDLLLVEIDDRTLEAYAQEYPLPRDQHGILLYGLLRAGARSVGMDLFFTTPSPTERQRESLTLQQMLARTRGRVALATHFRDKLQRVGGAPRMQPDSLLAARTIGVLRGERLRGGLEGIRPDLPLESFLAAGANLGHATLLLEPDGSTRRVPLVIHVGPRLLPTLALISWLQARGLSTEDVVADAGDGGLRRRSDGASLLPLDHGGVHDIAYAGDEDAFVFNRVSYIDALNLIRDSLSGGPGAAAADSMARQRFGGKVVLVGLTAPSSYDLDRGITPFGTQTPLLFVHANLLNDLLQGSRLRRVPAGWMLAAAGLLLLLGNVVGPRLKVAVWLVGTVIVILLLLVAAFLVFARADVAVPVVSPLLVLVVGTLGVAALTFLGQESERQILRATFEKYVAPDLLEGILANAGHIQLGGTLKQATIVFVDIRGFTAWARSMEPAQLVDELNAFLSEMVDVVFAAGGSVNKFLGDAILAVFGAPLEHDDDAQRALSAAREMQRRLREHNLRREQEGKPAIRMGIGVATGQVVAGNVGSSQRLEYTVIGNPVNLASRLQSLSLDGQVLVDRNTRGAVDGLPFSSLGSREIKGIEDPVEVFELRCSGAETPPA